MVNISQAAAHIATREIEQPLQTDLYFDDKFMVKQIVVQKAQTYVPQHVHPFDHTSMLALGSVRVWTGEGVSGSSMDYKAPIGIPIKAGIPHTFLTLEDNTILYCINILDEHGEVPILREHQLTEIG